MRERGQSSAGAGYRATQGNRSSVIHRRQPGAPGAAIVDREPSALPCRGHPGITDCILVLSENHAVFDFSLAAWFADLHGECCAQYSCACLRARIDPAHGNRVWPDSGLAELAARSEHDIEGRRSTFPSRQKEWAVLAQRPRRLSSRRVHGSVVGSWIVTARALLRTDGQSRIRGEERGASTFRSQSARLR